jgi:cytochrome P450
MWTHEGNNHILPFGTGRRLCPGIRFAMAALEVTLTSLVRRFDQDVFGHEGAPRRTTPPLAPLSIVVKYRALAGHGAKPPYTV